MNAIMPISPAISVSAGAERPTTRALPLALPRVTLAGAVAGAVNAALCFLRWPVPVSERSATFSWHVVPAGMVHGAILAGGAGLATWLAARVTSAVVRVEITVLIGWLGGYLSWIPLEMSLFGRSWLQAIVWPSSVSLSDAAWLPFMHFGAVPTLLAGALLALEGRPARRMVLAVSIGAGVLGSLPWWIEWGPWYFSLLHGGLWGALVGRALSARAPQDVRPCSG